MVALPNSSRVLRCGRDSRVALLSQTSCTDKLGTTDGHQIYGVVFVAQVASGKRAASQRHEQRFAWIVFTACLQTLSHLVSVSFDLAFAILYRKFHIAL